MRLIELAVRRRVTVLMFTVAVLLFGFVSLSRLKLNLLPDRFFTPDGALILCSSHGALFEKLTGYCVAGPCAGRSLTAVPLEVRAGYVMLADGVDIAALAEAAS